MKSILGASLLAGLLAFAAGCSSADAERVGVEPNGESPSKDDVRLGTTAPATEETTSSLAQSLRKADSSEDAAINPCAAATCLVGTTCEVIDGRATCTPAPSGGAPFCGGFAGIACPGAGSCVDDSSDDCDPERGGADCGGLCECSGALVLCSTGTQFDDSPDVCACVPAEPEPSGPFCGGIAAFECPGQGSCVDNPNDGCDPERGGADCGGLCECNVRALCIRGFAFDASPEVCARVPDAVAGPFCGGFAGIACPGAGSCVDNPNDGCDPERGGADCGGVCECSAAAASCPEGVPFDESPDVCACVPAEPVNPCAAVLCPVNTTCDVIDGEARCNPIAPSGPFCGGIAALECPGAGTCVGNPNDGCDPARGGADCGGLCECNVLALCIPGFEFDASPEVCACVATEPEVDACATVRCRAGTHCEVVDDRAICASDELTNPCAAASCLTGTVCVERRGQAVCIPADSEVCE